MNVSTWGTSLLSNCDTLPRRATFAAILHWRSPVLTDLQLEKGGCRCGNDAPKGAWKWEYTLTSGKAARRSGLRLIAPMLLLLVTPFCSAVAADAQPIVLILAGQSNMVGHGRMKDVADRGITAPPNVTFFLGTEETSLTLRDGFGPELTLAEECAAAVPDREIVLVKFAVGTTSLLDWAPDWDADRARITGNSHKGALYQQLMAVVEELSLASADVAGVLWMQGERDARIEEAGKDYYDNIRNLINAFRKDLNRQDLPFLMGKVNPPPQRYPARDNVRLAQNRIADDVPNVYLIETDDLSKWDDALHYDSEGILELGRRFARQLVAIGACR